MFKRWDLERAEDVRISVVLGVSIFIAVVVASVLIIAWQTNRSGLPWVVYIFGTLLTVGALGVWALHRRPLPPDISSRAWAGTAVTAVMLVCGAIALFIAAPFPSDETPGLGTFFLALTGGALVMRIVVGIKEWQSRHAAPSAGKGGIRMPARHKPALPDVPALMAREGTTKQDYLEIICETDDTSTTPSQKERHFRVEYLRYLQWLSSVHPERMTDQEASQMQALMGSHEGPTPRP